MGTVASGARRLTWAGVKLLPLLALLLLPGSADAARKKRAPADAPPPAPAAAPAPTMSAEEQAVVDAVRAHSPPPAEYVFLLDTAGPMLDVARGLRDDLAAIVDRLPEGDKVEVVALHTRPTVALESTQLAADNRAAVVERVRAMELTSAKDSDLGAGLAYATSRLNRADGAALQFVVLVSTFCHSPSVTSDYDSRGRGCRAIRGLPKMIESFQAGRKDRLAVATLLPVSTATQPVHPEGLEAARQFFGEVQVVDTTAQSPEAWAARYAAYAPLERVLPLVRSDAKNAGLSLRVVRQPTAQKPTAQIEVSGGTSWLGLSLTEVVASGAVAGALPPSMELAPTLTLEVPVTPPPTPFAILPNEDTVSLPITLSGIGQLQPAAGLGALGIDPARPALSATVNASWTRSYGLPAWLVGILLAGVAAVSAGTTIILRRRLRRVRLGGNFSYRYLGGARQAMDLGALEEAYIAVDPAGGLVVRRNGAVLAVRMVKQGLDAYAEAEIFADGVEINRKPARRGRHRVVSGATSFQFGDYRLTWE